MASAFSHMAVPALLFASFKSDSVNFKLFLLAAICSVIPDVDVVAFKFGIPYESQWGHRGFTHSLVFALCLTRLRLRPKSRELARLLVNYDLAHIG